ncbi:hypothetical protein V5799_020509 [Amblyomma americanum]|uniref:Secreted protein n=1 Tax=Amblyomma americanum TaxID=6943 RepID=A0AAQ4ETM7_AMBAM
MRFQFVAAFLVGTCISISTATRGEAIKDFGNKKCERAVPLPPWASAYRGKCTYICKGWPLRVENEPDGIACGRPEGSVLEAHILLRSAD